MGRSTLGGLAHHRCRRRRGTGPIWALVVGGILIGLACLVALGAALNRDYPAGEAVGFVVGAPLIPFLLMLGGRAIVLRMQNSRAPVLDWPWIIFGTGIIALVLSFANSAQDAEDDGGGDARVPAVTAAL